MSINRITREDVAKFKANLFADASGGIPNAIDFYQQIATKSAVYPGQGTALGMVYCSLKLNGEAGEVAEHVGKAMRDDALMISEDIGADCPYYYSGDLTPQRRDAIRKEIGDCAWYLSALCNELGEGLSYALLANLEKLCDRTERDALRGSGDDR